jgi:translocation and assembly module TamB
MPSAGRAPPARPRVPLDLGRLLARVLCVLFALIGALPLGGGALARTAPVRQWAADETARLLRELLGVEATYEVAVSFWPLELALTRVRIPSSDGGSPAFAAERMAVTPRIFSLLAGRLDVGDIELDAPRGRIVVRDGAIANIALRLPESTGAPPPRLERAPFASLAITDARIELDVEGVRVATGSIDLDVFAEAGPAFEVALRVGESEVTTERASSPPGADSEDTAPGMATDEDVLCQLDLRMRVELGGGLLRRLSLQGAIDDDDRPGTRPACGAEKDDAHRVLARLSQVRVRLDEDFIPTRIDGHVVLKTPVSFASRFGAGSFSGWVAVAGDAHYDAARELPDFRGRVRGGAIGVGPYSITEAFDGQAELKEGIVRVSRMQAQYGHGEAVLHDVRVEPLAPGVPLHVRRVEGAGVQWEDFMEKNDVTKDTIVQWKIEKAVVSEFGGTLDPVKLDGELYAETTGFEVFDRAYHRKDKKHIIGVSAATVRGKFGVRPNAVQFMNTHATFGTSSVHASVSVGFDNTLWLDAGKNSVIELADISPLVDIRMSGRTGFSVKMAGIASEAELKGNLSVENLVFGGFPLGDIQESVVRFRPLKLDITDVKGKKGASEFRVPSARLDFDTEAVLLADAVVESPRMNVRDFFHMWHFDEDPRFADIAGHGKVQARVHYDMGGKKDACKTGYLRVDGSLESDSVDLLEEHYDRVAGNFDFRWFDNEASHLGLQLTIPDLMLAKGTGTFLGDVKVTEGGVVNAHIIGTAVPLSKIQAMGELGRRLDGHVSAVAEVGGTIDAMTANVQVTTSPIRMGRRTMAPSRLAVKLAPEKRPLRTTGKTACGRPKPAPFDPVEYDADARTGTFHVDGKLFGKQVALEDLAITRQRHKVLSGRVRLRGLDLGAVAELSPEIALSDRRPEGTIDATITLAELALSEPGRARATLDLAALSFGRDDVRVALEHPARVSIANGRADLTDMTLAVTMPGGQRGSFDLRGHVTKLDRVPVVDVGVTLRPTQLGAFRTLVPKAERLAGTLEGGLRVTGPVTDLSQEGRFQLTGGSIVLRGAPVSIDDLRVVVDLHRDEIVLSDASATVGGGSVKMRGRAPLRGFELGPSRASITARGIEVPIASGVRTAVDADLEVTHKPAKGMDAPLPRLAGNVSLRSFSYTRKVTMTADITSLGKRGRKTQFDSYDPALDLLELDILITSAEPLRIENDLLEATLMIEKPGLQLSGTNQKFGMRGQVAVVKGGAIRLRRSEFEITDGLVRFDDSERIAPKVDVTAVTEYTRYADAVGVATDVNLGSSATGAGTAGARWRITMRAHGDAENLRVDLSSEPELGQDDIFLLLTLGLTRAELDQAQSASAGQSVALEALGRLTGADRAVTESIPVIDEFRFGSAYSSRTGRTEPTVTIGKRLTQRIRAFVTSGLTESREVRSNLEWRLNNRVSAEGSYDNVNDISSSALGNLGADIRWRLEFE